MKNANLYGSVDLTGPRKREDSKHTNQDGTKRLLRETEGICVLEYAWKIKQKNIWDPVSSRTRCVVTPSSACVMIGEAFVIFSFLKKKKKQLKNITAKKKI